MDPVAEGVGEGPAAEADLATTNPSIASNSQPDAGPDPAPAARDAGAAPAIDGGDDGEADDVFESSPGEAAEDPHAHRPDAVALIREPRSTFPESYSQNTAKEQAVLDFVDNFVRQYRQLYNNRKPLYICPPNECGVPKLVCTTVRATQLPFRQLYDHEETARFVSSFLTYDFLPTADPPDMLQSPATTLWNQRGNCFDFSVLLCALLEGAGYDAYVVHGYATREICMLDRSRREHDVKTTAADIPVLDEKQAKPPNKYRVKSSLSLESKFDKMMAEREATKTKKKAEVSILDEAKARAERRKPVIDRLHGLRTHCWVMVLRGKRGVPEDFFIEPSLGETASVRSEDYLGIEAVWNSKNFWSNMQDCTEGVLDMAYDLTNTSKWEYLFPDDSFSWGPKKTAAAGPAKSFDLPPTWVEELHIRPLDFATGRPHGERELVEQNCRVHEFAEYHREDGMVQQTTYYSDYELTQEVLRVDAFKNRKDCLERLEVKELEDRDQYDEIFRRGRHSGLRHHIFFKGHWAGSKVNENRTMYFFNEARVDGLYMRKQSKGAIEEVFRNREDKLLTRVTHFVVDGEDGAAQPARRRTSISGANSRRPSGPDKDKKKASGPEIDGITETFGRNTAVPADEDIKEINYYDDAIMVTYHRHDERATAQFREFEKPAKTEKQTYAPISVDDGEGVLQYHPDPKQVLTKNFAANKIFADLLSMERKARGAVTASLEEINAIIRKRRTEETSVSLSLSFYDTTRNADAKAKRLAQEEAAAALAAKNAEMEKDYLAPFLVRHSEPTEKLPGMDTNVDKIVRSNGSMANTGEDWKTGDGMWAEALLTMYDIELKLFLERAKFTKEEEEDLVAQRRERRVHTIAESCLKDFIERAAQKEGRIVGEIETQKKSLAEKQQWYQENQATLESSEEEEYVAFCGEKLHTLRVLERRLEEHRKERNRNEIALKSRLREDSRLDGWLPAC
mmetsp:Transcript_11522/g.29514  ORF Transcript_11522/g.29514 Transcript_11522/m.29514 type:complete len:965 (-) Transcript_11522:1299-4193(-)